MNQTEIVDAEFEEIKEDTTIDVDIESTSNTIASTGKFSRAEALKAIAEALKEGNITGRQAREIRRDMGITQAYFTRKQPTATQRRAKRKAQKAARRANRSK